MQAIHNLHLCSMLYYYCFPHALWKPGQNAKFLAFPMALFGSLACLCLFYYLRFFWCNLERLSLVEDLRPLRECDEKFPMLFFLKLFSFYWHFTPVPRCALNLVTLCSEHVLQRGVCVSSSRNQGLSSGHLCLSQFMGWNQFQGDGLQMGFRKLVGLI